MNDTFPPNEIRQELDEIFNSIGNFVPRYLKIRDSYKFKLFNSVYDILRMEICKCIMMELNQASITLTNHLLEKFLKLSLIYQRAGFKYLSDIDETQQALTEATNFYMNKELVQTINMACSAGIISKEEKKQLNIYRDTLRNAYSHADSNKIFGEQEINVAYGSLDNSKKIASASIKIAHFPMLQGEAQEAQAKQQATSYFLYIDHLVCREDVKQHPEIIGYNNNNKMP